MADAVDVANARVAGLKARSTRYFFSTFTLVSRTGSLE
jgi:hypothetical protein